MTAVVIVQARTGSTRLPGKVLRDLRGAPVLTHVLSRAAAIPGVEKVCCAIPDVASDDELAQRAADLGAVVVRGPEEDVLTRYLLAARACDASIIMRITSDCPLLDPHVSGMVLQKLAANQLDYTSNVDPRSWPRGLDTEAFTREALERAAVEAKAPYDREHVTPWLRNHPSVKRANVAHPNDRYAAWRWTLDYEEDLVFLKATLAHFPPLPYLPNFDEISALIDTNPELSAINSHLR